MSGNHHNGQPPGQDQNIAPAKPAQQCTPTKAGATLALTLSTLLSSQDSGASRTSTLPGLRLGQLDQPYRSTTGLSNPPASRPPPPKNPPKPVNPLARGTYIALRQLAKHYPAAPTESNPTDPATPPEDAETRTLGGFAMNAHLVLTTTRHGGPGSVPASPAGPSHPQGPMNITHPRRLRQIRSDDGWATRELSPTVSPSLPCTP